MAPLVGRYILTRLLGTGGSGEVFLALDRARGDLPVALKRIRAEMDELLRAAFEREFSVMASLSVAGIAKVYDFGIAPPVEGFSGGPFFTRAYVEGQALSCAVQGLSVQRRLTLFAQLCDVVSPLHRVGVAHGDIKPGNVIVTPDAQVSVIDFGLSRMLGRAGGRVVRGGTPPFMAPELLEGDVTSVSGDIYALGAVLWQLMSNRLPFSELGPLATKAKLAGERPAVPDGLSPIAQQALAIAERALRREPLDRFPAVTELLSALSPLLPARAEIEPAFVAPRPRGHEDVLAELEHRLGPATVDAERERVWVLSGGQGSGKSLLLRELRWRLQLRGVLVLSLSAPAEPGRAPHLWLIEQLRLLCGEAPVGSGGADDPGVPIPSSEAAGLLAGYLAECSALGPVALLIDDLDQAERVLGEVLRSALFDEHVEQVVLLAAAADASAPAIQALGGHGVVPLRPLTSGAVAALCADVLGPVDAGVLTTLAEATQGMPAALMEALAALRGVQAPTEADVRALQPGRAGEALAQARLALADDGASGLFFVLAVCDGVPVTLAERLLGGGERGAMALRRLQHQAITVRRRGADVGFADANLGKTVWNRLDASERRARAQALLADGKTADLPVVALARLAVAAEDGARLRKFVPRAVEELCQTEAHAAAVALNEALLPHLPAAEADEVRLAIAQGRQAMGEHAAAAEFATALASASATSAGVRAEASIVAARALAAMARYDDAVAVLSAEPCDLRSSDRVQRVRIQRELARVHMRRGDYRAVTQAADTGLQLAAEDDLSRVELLCCKGQVAVYGDRHKEARGYYEQALALALSAGSTLDEAKVHGYLAIGCFRAGEPEEAKTQFIRALSKARENGDIAFMANASLNLGGILYYLGDPAAAEMHYQSAARLARRAGSVGTDIQARNNLAHVHVYLGVYERARSELQQVVCDADQRGLRHVQAQVRAVLGDLYARTGDLERALVSYDDAIVRYRALGQMREVAEHELDAAEALLDRDGSSDVSAAARRLSAALEIIDKHGLSDLTLRRELLTARARLSSGEADAVVVHLEELVEQARAAKKRDLEWSALAAAARSHMLLGAEFAAASQLRRAVEILEDQAVRLPREYRDAFWQDPRRRALRAQMANLADSSSHRRLLDRGDLVKVLADPRTSRFLDIVRRLAAEHDLDRLLSRIVDSAVELSGAERGYVLLVDDSGQLVPHVSRQRSGAAADPSVAFSRSISEAVLIDGDSIVSVDATHDGRFSDYASVHQLTLRSVACLPIRGLERTIGVLYLEHRRSRGCFTEAVVDLLHAFADQAAIALNNARLLSENRKRQAQLERANAELAAAKRELEDALSARTEELQEVRTELSRVRGEKCPAIRYGMVGSSPAMAKVFSAIDRLKDAVVPVVIRGESGTGKELVARAVHYAGRRQQAPFIVVNCGALPANLLESELFGHIRGAFSGAERERSGLIARAHGGTLFLDEVADMPPKMQIDLLRVIQEGTLSKLGSDEEERVSVRFVAATQRNLKDLVAEGKFREDLYYRLNAVELVLPPLRERVADIPELCAYLLKSMTEREGLAEKRLTAPALRELMAAPWPGNVRQLRHILLQAALLTQGPAIGAEDLSITAAPEGTPEEAREQAPVVNNLAHEQPLAGSVDEYRELEKRRILEALEATGWNRARAAQTLGMARRTFYRRLQEYQIL